MTSVEGVIRIDYSKGSRSLGFQADTVDLSACPPEGGRYMNQQPALIETAKQSRRPFFYITHGNSR